jgi:hypothetical protein
MTPNELKTLIESDAEASQCWADRRDAACAARCSVIAPVIYREARLRWNRIAALYSDLGTAANVRAKIEAAALTNPLVADIADSLKASSQDPCDLGHPTVRALLTLSTNHGGIGLTQQEAAPLLAVGTQRQAFSTDDVQQAMGA